MFCKAKEIVNYSLYRVMKILSKNTGIGIIEVILVLVVIIALVLIFKPTLTDMLSLIFDKIANGSFGT